MSLVKALFTQFEVKSIPSNIPGVTNSTSQANMLFDADRDTMLELVSNGTIAGDGTQGIIVS